MKQVKVLSEKEFKHALAICEIVQKSKRDPIMLLLSNYAGLRVGEITSLKWSEVLDRNEKPKTMFYSKAENTKAKEARQVHLNARLKTGAGCILEAAAPMDETYRYCDPITKERLIYRQQLGASV